MRTAVTAAGSRNTPIIEAIVAEQRIRAYSHIDERSGGFFAVGAARGDRLPVAITVTSGTAVANLLPAVVEASEARLGLIVLSADRPAELRQIGAGQTIDQVKIFGPYTRFFAELDLYEATPERIRWVRAMACRAYFTAAGPNAGPVHLNIPLREPLVLDGPLPADPVGSEGRGDGRPWIATSPPSTPALGGATPGPVAATAAPLPAPAIPPRTLLVAGALDPADAGAVVEFAERNSLPLLADPLSGARRGLAAIAHYDLLLRDRHFTAALAPAAVIRVGELPTSKPLRAWLAALPDSLQMHVGAEPAWNDPASVTALTLSVDPVAFFASATIDGAPDPAWLPAWRRGDSAAATVIDRTLGAALSEPKVSQLLAGALAPATTLVVAASMPIRDVEEFFPVRDDGPRVLANRGANGIDGTVSTAFGVAATTAAPTVLLIGDVALAHDIGGLLCAKRTGLKLTIVVINNDGGGIFNFLAIADGHEAAFTHHVATPHGLDFAHAAALYGFGYAQPTDVGGFTAALDSALAGAASTIIEVRTDRAANRRLHADVAAALTRALSPTAPAATPPA